MKKDKVDTRISVDVELDEHVLLALCLAAHDSDMTLNEYANGVLRSHIESVELPRVCEQAREVTAAPSDYKRKKKISMI